MIGDLGEGGCVFGLDCVAEVLSVGFLIGMGESALMDGWVLWPRFLEAAWSSHIAELISNQTLRIDARL